MSMATYLNNDFGKIVRAALNLWGCSEIYGGQDRTGDHGPA